MNKKVLYKNTCTLNFMSIDKVLEIPKEKLVGRRVITIQQNNFFSCGVIVATGEMLPFLNYSDHKVQSYLHLLSFDDLKKADINAYPYEQYKKTIESNKGQYSSMAFLDYGTKAVLFLDEYDIVIDADDEDPFKDNVINLLSYDKEIDYYSRGHIFAVQDTAKSKTEIQTMFLYHGAENTKFMVEPGDMDYYDSVKYLNYLFNFDIYIDGEEFDLLL